MTEAGWSTCPDCDKQWLVTPQEDCFMPACGCYGYDTSADNPHRPCEPCGMIHAGLGDTPVRTVRVVATVELPDD